MTSSLAWSQSGRTSWGCCRCIRRPVLAASSGEAALATASMIARPSGLPAHGGHAIQNLLWLRLRCHELHSASLGYQYCCHISTASSSGSCSSQCLYASIASGLPAHDAHQ